MTFYIDALLSLKCGVSRESRSLGLKELFATDMIQAV